MKVSEDLIITSMTLDGNDVRVPQGLSQLLNDAGAWKYVGKENKNENKNLEKYDRKVSFEDGKLRTYLTCKVTSQKGKAS
ncbi:hypothetical protein [Heyndrickxia sp. FSL W8-0423]|uniref:hypothetical protein n=1 Tax=Heyndrickxia sp. FSL W8-0423 TaxID=2921601 RepID=UPI0030FAF281